MILIKSGERGWDLYKADRNYDGRLVWGDFLGTVETAGELATRVAILAQREMGGWDDNGCDPDTGFPRIAEGTEELSSDF